MSNACYMIDATIRIPHGLWHQFHAACLAHQTIPSTVLREAMEDALERWEADEQLKNIGRLSRKAWPHGPWIPSRFKDSKGS